MNLKFLAAAPVMAFLTVLMVRGLSAPPSNENQAQATAPLDTPAPALNAPSSPYFDLARVAFDDGTRGAVNARAVELFRRAQEQTEAIAWIDKHCRTVAGDVAYLKNTYGTVTGKAEQFTEFLNRSAELAACALAHHWLVSGGIAVDASPGVTPDEILNKYHEVYPSNGKQSADSAEG